MANNIVDSFLENQEDLTALIGSHLLVQVAVESMKLELDITGAQHIAGKTPHALREISYVVSSRIYRPNDIAHGVHELTRQVRDSHQWLRHHVAILSHLPPHNFAENGNLREIGSDVIMQIRGNPRPHSLQFQELSEPEAIKGIH